MQTRNRAFDDAARVAGGALGALTGIRREIEALIRHQLDRLLGGMDLVTRDEFEAVREMAANARAENDRLAARLAALEKAAAAPGAKAADESTDTSADESAGKASGTAADGGRKAPKAGGDGAK